MREAFSGKAIDDLPPSWFYQNTGFQQITGQRLPLWRASDEMYASAASPEEAFNANRTNPVVRACIEEIMHAAIQPRWEIGVETADGQWEPIAGHWLQNFLGAEINREDSFSDFIREVVARLMLTGKAHVWKWRGGMRNVSEVWSMPCTVVRELRNKSAQGPLVAGYKVTGFSEIVTPEDMFRLRRIDPGQVNGALGSMASAFGDYKLDQERMNYMAEMLLNLKVPGLVVKTKQQMNPQQRRKLLKEIREEIGAETGNRGNILLASGEGDVSVVSPLSDLDWPGFSEQVEARICMSFGVPPILAGARLGLLRSTYSNYETARRSFYQETMASQWELLSEGLTKGLLYQEGETRLRLRPRYDELPEFQEDEEKKTRRVTLLYQAKLITREEARVDLGRPEAPELGEFASAADFGLPGGNEDSKKEETPPDKEETEDEPKQNGNGAKSNFQGLFK